jgi:hypothetical protein
VHLSTAQRSLIEEILADLAGIDGVAAVVLGGTHARGRARPDSDIDLGILYRADRRFDVAAIRKLAGEWSDTPDPVVSGFGEWGRWVDGGAWLTVRGQRIDFLYRDIGLIESTLAEAREGRFEVDFAQQPPFGFFGPTVLGEVAIAQPLHDPDGLVAVLRSEVLPMPDALRCVVVQQGLWSVDFGLRAFAPKFVAAGNAYGAAGCFTRFGADLVRVLFALNGTYPLNDKTALAEIAEFPDRVPEFGSRLSEILGNAGTDAQALSHSMRAMQALFEDVARIAGELYRPAWRF